MQAGEGFSTEKAADGEVVKSFLPGSLDDPAAWGLRQ